MAQTFKETAHLHTNVEKYNEGYERIFGKKDAQKESEQPVQNEELQVKELARESYKELGSGQDTEGFPESSSYIYGFVKGYKAAKEGR